MPPATIHQRAGLTTRSHCVNLFALASNARQGGSRGLSWDPGVARVANGQFRTSQQQQSSSTYHSVAHR